MFKRKATEWGADDQETKWEGYSGFKSIPQIFMSTWNLRNWPYLKKVFCRCNWLWVLRWNYPGFRMSPESSDWCPYKQRRGHRDTHRKKPCKDTGRDQSDGATSQGTPEPREAGKGRKDAADTLTSGLQNCERVNFCCFRQPSLQCFVKATLGRWGAMAKTGPQGQWLMGRRQRGTPGSKSVSRIWGHRSQAIASGDAISCSASQPADLGTSQQEKQLGPLAWLLGSRSPFLLHLVKI